jgi:hypothetical protein
MAYEDDDAPDDTNEYFDLDTIERKPKKRKSSKPEPLFRVYRDSKVPVSKATGPRFKTMRDHAQKANALTHEAWNEVFRYYNNHQVKAVGSPVGTFKRGDGIENVVYSNINVMLPAVYGKDPDFVVNTTDNEDKPFTDSAKRLLNALFKSKKYLNAKYKLKRAAGLALLTNAGILKLDYVQKADSREAMNEELAQIGEKLRKAKNQKELDTIYGQLEALEESMVVFQPAGPKLYNVLPQNWVIDPMAEDPDGTDAQWQMERKFFNTNFLKARYLKPCEGEEDADQYAYLFKPTHKANFDGMSDDSKSDPFNMVMDSLGDDVTEHEEEERSGYRGMYYTECWLVWDKPTRRVYLFASDDWTWPLWVWEDPFKLTQFYPYFLIAFGMSTGGTITVGETSYYLDQQDEINTINREVARIRRGIYKYFFYNSEKINRDEMEKVVKAIRGEATGADDKGLVGVAVPEGQTLKDLMFAADPPSMEYEALFNKEPLLAAINRISNTSDAIRGVQFKSNTTDDAVQTYQDAARMSIGAKVEVIEDRVGEIGYALLEMCVQFMDKETVEGIIGKKSAEGYNQMEVSEFQSRVTAEVVGGTTEKPNSMFKKKEAIQVTQAIGQFADAAPGSAMKIMLGLLQNAFTEINISAEDWELMAKEIIARNQRGNSTGGGAPAEGAPPPEGGGGAGALPEQLANLPPEVKRKIEEMKAAGASDEELKAVLQQALAGGGAPPQQGAPTGAPIQ